jgi:hypothetical protein
MTDFTKDLFLASLFLARYGPDDCKVERCGLTINVRLPRADERLLGLRPEWETLKASANLPERPTCLLLEGVAV